MYKRQAYLDVLSESINKAIRLLLGWFFGTADYLPPVTIVLGYWLGGAFLMAIKLSLIHIFPADATGISDAHTISRLHSALLPGEGFPRVEGKYLSLIHILGTLPPNTFSANTNSPSSVGSNSIHTSPNWP